MAERWTARHAGGATTTMTEREVREHVRQAGYSTCWLDDGHVRIGSWTITREKKS